MKKSIFVLLALISVSFITAQSKCEESFEFISSELIDNSDKVPVYKEGFVKIKNKPVSKVFKDGTIFMPTQYDGNSFLLQSFNKDLKLINESKISFDKQCRKAHWIEIVKKDNYYYAVVNFIQKKTNEYYGLKYDNDFNLISKKLLGESPRANFKGYFGFFPPLSFQNSPNNVEVFGNQQKFKINFPTKDDVTTKIFNLDFKELSSFKYEDPSRCVPLFNDLDKDGSLYTIYFSYNKKTKKVNTNFRKISAEGGITIKDITKDLPSSLFMKSLVDAKSLVKLNQISLNKKYHVIYPLISSKIKQGFRKITIDKENLTVQLNEVIAVKKKITEKNTALSYKTILKDNSLYISVEVINKSKKQPYKNYTNNKSHSTLRERNNKDVYLDFGNVYVYKINLETNKVDWETKINKLNESIAIETDKVLADNKHQHYSFGWGFKNDNLLMFLNSNDKITNNKFSTKQKTSVFNKTTPTSLYCINLNTQKGTFCYKKISENKDVIFNVKIFDKNHPLTFLGRNKKAQYIKAISF